MILDASALIAVFATTDRHHETARRIVIAASGPLWMHPINLAEVFVGPARAGRLPRYARAVSALGVDEVAVPTGEAAPLALLRARTGLRLPDCCVLRAAEITGETEIVTFDHDLARRAVESGLTVLA